MKRWVWLLSLALVAAPITLWGATVKWQAVTTYTDGSTITVPVEYQVYTGPAADGPWTAVGGKVSVTQAAAPDPAAGSTLWYTADAWANGVNGAKGAAASKTTPFPNPAGVTGITVE